MNRFLLPFICLFSTQAFAGNVIEMSTRDMSGKEIDRTVFYTESDRSRMDQSGGGGSHSVIFLEDTFLILDHAEKSYMVMDEAMLESMGEQVSAAMKEMEAQLAKLPPEQREMVRQMMSGQMGGMGMPTQVPVLEVRKLGADRWQSYDCTLAEMLEDGEKIQEICSVDFDEVDGAGALRESFLRMTGMLNKLYEEMPFGGEGARNPMEALDELDGFPVRTVDIENGKPVRETVLESSQQKAIDGDIFEAPSDYSRRDPFGR
jgi:hypothetical protein